MGALVRSLSNLMADYDGPVSAPARSAFELDCQRAWIAYETASGERAELSELVRALALEDFEASCAGAWAFLTGVRRKVTDVTVRRAALALYEEACDLAYLSYSAKIRAERDRRRAWARRNRPRVPRFIN